MHSLNELKTTLEPYRHQLIDHSLYAAITDLASLRVFMEHHVFAVWDFMSLLKALQNRFTGLETPWHPAGNRLACRLINEIVLGEESDEDGRGGYASHFELYLRSMTDCGCDVRPMHEFLERLQHDRDLLSALNESSPPPASQRFVHSTFELIERGDSIEIASAFTFGREDLLPDVFRKIVERIDREESGTLQSFLFYLDRHIELDEDRHGPMADRLMIDLCGEDANAWKRAEQAAIGALESRLALWDAITAEMVTQSPATC
ncbi:MAG: DUF3050 domain-containing protein [Planctomycetaceae bacterium]|nr:DUF3050 domain-containing protein [Planctomycetaceae bacterium]